MPPDPNELLARDRIRFQHMMDAASDLADFVRGRTLDDLRKDAMLRRAVTNAVQEIGEAVAKTSDLGRARVPSIPWGSVVAMRHILVHVYWGVDIERLWKAATLDAPTLLKALRDATANWPLPDQRAESGG